MSWALYLCVCIDRFVIVPSTYLLFILELSWLLGEFPFSNASQILSLMSGRRVERLNSGLLESRKWDWANRAVRLRVLWERAKREARVVCKGCTEDGLNSCFASHWRHGQKGAIVACRRTGRSQPGGHFGRLETAFVSILSYERLASLQDSRIGVGGRWDWRVSRDWILKGGVCCAETFWPCSKDGDPLKEFKWGGQMWTDVKFRKKLLLYKCRW